MTCYIPKARSFIIKFLFIIYFPLTLNGQWVIVEPFPSNSGLNCVFFADSLNGWIAGNDGKIFRSGDGGESWLFCNLPPSIQDNNIRFLCFTNSDTGWAVGDMGLIKTIDGGANWSEPLPNIYKSYDLDFVDSEHGWVGCYDRILKTVDGGMSFETCVYHCDAQFNHIDFFDSLNGVANGIILEWGPPPYFEEYVGKTTDGGNSWETIAGHSYIGIRDLFFLDPLNCWYVSEYWLRSTIDGGNSWNTDSLHGGNSVFFHSKNHGWVGDFGKIHHQIDDSTWEEQPFYLDKEIRSIYFIDSLTGWAVGYSEDSPLGILLKTNNGGLVGIEGDNKDDPGHVIVYPNPFIETTTFHFSLTHPSMIRIEIYDLRGIKIDEIVQIVNIAGNFEVIWNAVNHPPGVYLFRFLVDGEMVGNGKFIKL